MMNNILGDRCIQLGNPDKLFSLLQEIYTKPIVLKAEGGIFAQHQEDDYVQLVCKLGW